MVSLLILNVAVMSSETGNITDETLSESSWAVKNKKIMGQEVAVYFMKKRDNHTDWEPAPDSVISSSKNLLAERMGAAYVDEYIEFRSARRIPVEVRGSSNDEIYYVDFFHIIKINKYKSYYVISTYLDSLGNVRRSEGVINRSEIPTLGMPYSVDDTSAVKLAQDIGLKPGSSPWELRFYYHVTEGKYVWNVKNYISGTHGNYLLIDPHNASVIKKDRWRSIEN